MQGGGANKSPQIRPYVCISVMNPTTKPAHARNFVLLEARMCWNGGILEWVWIDMLGGGGMENQMGYGEGGFASFTVHV